MVGILRNARGEVLLGRRRAGGDLGGLWEFPGGKREAGESRRDALARELSEELGISIVDAAPLDCFEHSYPGKPVLLDVWSVARWSGSPYGRERQPIRWVELDQLDRWPMPLADRPIVAALRAGLNQTPSAR